MKLRHFFGALHLLITLNDRLFKILIDNEILDIETMRFFFEEDWESLGVSTRVTLGLRKIIMARLVLSLLT